MMRGGHIDATVLGALQVAGSAELPLNLRRCDHLRLEMRGWGEMKLFSITREMSAY